MNQICFEPIGVVRSPFHEKKDAPRQPAASEASGTIVLSPGRRLEDALDGMAAWSHLWVVYVFDRAGGYRPKVQPPRAGSRKGVLATRSPHRPNAIGLSAVRLVGVRGLELDVTGVDMLDGTPVLDLKPYVSYTDVVRDASAGWLAPDPIAPWQVEFSDAALVQVATLRGFGVDLDSPIRSALSLGPAPHAYRRIRRDGDQSVLAVKDYRVRFIEREGRRLEVLAIQSGYTHRQLLADDANPALAPHRALCFA